jgi:hypothetical protein
LLRLFTLFCSWLMRQFESFGAVSDACVCAFELGVFDVFSSDADAGTWSWIIGSGQA